RPEYQKRKDKICPFSSLAFFQPTTVDKEPEICPFSSLADFNPLQLTKSLISIKIDMEIIKPLLV
ncbi:hypothetical protein, partial [Streptococcus pneumoniae]|uniref:hypothetical protein n=1 Tax=Streptococcus pneumoniae TaxID=1313 RepID=UPI001C721D1F